MGALERLASFGGSALARPQAGGGGGLAGADRLAVRVGLGALSGHRLEATLRLLTQNATLVHESSGGGGSSARTGWPNSVQASLRHSHSWSGPPRALLAGWPQVGHRGGRSLMVGLYRSGAKWAAWLGVAPHPSGASGVMATWT